MMGSSWARWRRSSRCWESPADHAPVRIGAQTAKETVWGQALVTASSPLTAATRLHLEEGTEVLGVPIHSTLYHLPVGTHLGTLKGKFARTCAAVAALSDTQCAHALMRSCLGPTKVRSAHLASPSHGGLRGGHHCNPAGHVGHGGGHAHV